MQYTENYNLNKPELTDVADITKLSDNMDIIDEELEKRTTKTGFLTDLITHLASDAAIAISSLSTDSVFYRLLSYALNAAGVQYNFTNANAWYICLGALFGGLIIQGGRELSTDSTGEKTITLSVTLTSLIYATANMTKLGVGAGEVGFQYNGSNIINVYAYTAKAVGFSWLAIGW